MATKAAVNNNEPTDPAPSSETTDKEGLLLCYDVIICGTGLVQSILASALARAGKTVLHCDAQPYYGGMDAVLTLPYVQEATAEEGNQLWGDNNKKEEEGTSAKISDNKSIALNALGPTLTLQSTKTLTSDPLGIGKQVSTPYGKGTIESIINRERVEISLSQWTLADGTSPTLYIRIPAASSPEDVGEYLKTHHQVESVLLKDVQDYLRDQSRSFALDMTPTLIFGSGAAVQGFIKSGVADYVEFQSMEGMYYYDVKQRHNRLTRVPCSKSEVFATKLLSPLEKRKLMKFLQLVMDYGISMNAAQEKGEEEQEGEDQHEREDEEEEEESTTTTAASTTGSEEDVQSHNERKLNQGRSLARPQNKAVSSQDLQSLQEAISSSSSNVDFTTYLSETQKLKGSLLQLVRHALALETSSSSTTSLADGMKRLVQHVQGLGQFGVTAFLAPLYGSGEFSQSFCRSAAVHGATYLLRRTPKNVVVKDDGTVDGIVIDDAADDGTPRTKTIQGKHVIVSSHYLKTSKSSQKKVLRRISVLRGKIIPETSFQRHIIIIPPEGSGVAIHGLLLDHSTKVVPFGCTLLHLTCTVDDSSNENGSGSGSRSLLEKTAQEIVAGTEAIEIYHLEFSYPIPTSPASSLSTKGLHVAHTASPSLIADDAFEQAKALFQEICPDQDFLSLSEEMNKTIQEGIMGGADEEDEERDVLNRAVETLLDNKNNNNDDDYGDGGDTTDNTKSTETGSST